MKLMIRSNSDLDLIEDHRFLSNFEKSCREACKQAAAEGKYYAQIQLPNHHSHRWDEMISYVTDSFKNEDVYKVETTEPNVTLLQISWQGI